MSTTVCTAALFEEWTHLQDELTLFYIGNPNSSIILKPSRIYSEFITFGGLCVGHHVLLRAFSFSMERVWPPIIMPGLTRVLFQWPLRHLAAMQSTLEYSLVELSLLFWPQPLQFLTTWPSRALIWSGQTIVASLMQVWKVDIGHLLRRQRTQPSDHFDQTSLFFSVYTECRCNLVRLQELTTWAWITSYSPSY